jgi:hypothetical protein
MRALALRRGTTRRSMGHRPSRRRSARKAPQRSSKGAGLITQLDQSILRRVPELSF